MALALIGLKINFHKSDLVCFANAQEHSNMYDEIFACGQMPVSY
jgi:hypothetical protein